MVATPYRSDQSIYERSKPAPEVIAWSSLLRSVYSSCTWGGSSARQSTDMSGTHVVSRQLEQIRTRCYADVNPQLRKSTRFHHPLTSRG
jgi:hypothetical protein